MSRKITVIKVDSPGSPAGQWGAGGCQLGGQTGTQARDNPGPIWGSGESMEREKVGEGCSMLRAQVPGSQTSIPSM